MAFPSCVFRRKLGSSLRSHPATRHSSRPEARGSDTYRPLRLLQLPAWQARALDFPRVGALRTRTHIPVNILTLVLFTSNRGWLAWKPILSFISRRETRPFRFSLDQSTHGRFGATLLDFEISSSMGRIRIRIAAPSFTFLFLQPVACDFARFGVIRRLVVVLAVFMLYTYPNIPSYSLIHNLHCLIPVVIAFTCACVWPAVECRMKIRSAHSPV